MLFSWAAIALPVLVWFWWTETQNENGHPFDADTLLHNAVQVLGMMLLYYGWGLVVSTGIALLPVALVTLIWEKVWGYRLVNFRGDVIGAALAAAAAVPILRLALRRQSEHYGVVLSILLLLILTRSMSRAYTSRPDPRKTE